MTARPIISQADEGELVRTQVSRLVKARGSDTDEALAFAVVTLEGGFQGPPVHRHIQNAETFYILEGEYRFLVDGAEHVVGSGGFVFVPVGVPHAFVSAHGRPGKMIEIFTPADFESYFDEIATIIARGGSQAEVAAAQQKYAMEVLGPPLGKRDA